MTIPLLQRFADLTQSAYDVPEMPLRDLCIAANDARGGDALFDHLVGAGEQGSRNVDAERSGCRQVDNQLELARLHDR